ncbi:ABC transporter substrate-binding protein [Intrasporangium oryzae]|uniref:ABC transporter substrate-binding protein n=1 Tax=Intrasporangium oryzae TaxID=412687 RepID=UPI0004B0FB87|nr:ABC transporter substrate-binding protein [Intrasporangium oryzae]
MTRQVRAAFVAAVVVVLTIVGGVAACSTDLVGGGAADRLAAAPEGAPQPGGDLSVLVAGEVATWDPQLMYVGPEAFFAERTFVRTLTAYGTGADQRTLVGDLATSAGTPSDGGRTWTFTLRDGITWEDGSPVTCADIRHGVARTFDRTTHIAGTNYASFLLDVPTAVTAEGLEKPVYSGPGDKADQAAFDKALVCKGRTIVFHLREPEPDFAHIVALPEFAPRKASADTKDAKATFSVMSTGPYKLAKPWVVGKGGTFVRNGAWDPASDPIRKAYPDTITVTSGLDEPTIIQRLLNDKDQDAYAVSWVQASPTLRNQAGSMLQARLTFPYTGNVDYLALNMRSKVMSNPKVREAFALATNRATYVAANGGEGAGSPSWSILGPAISSVGTDPGKAGKVAGDPQAARALLQSSGLRLPVKVRVVHAQSVLADKAYAALAAGWERAGFDIELVPVQPEEYYKTIEKATSVNAYDVFRGVWTPDYPSAGAVIPALFDARINVDSSGPGQDAGYFGDAAVERLIDQADATADEAARGRIWEQADALIRERGGYVALCATKALHVHGGSVRHYEEHAVGGIVDLATVSVR